ncbi:MAG TPA: hypothetical protein VID48_08775, partial [Solirubrobacteraceae bacterium]
MPDVVGQLLVTEAALDKLGARGISPVDAEQALWNHHVLITNRRGSPIRSQKETRRLLIGRDDGGMCLTFVIEETIEPTIWLLVTGWESTSVERVIFSEVMSHSDTDPLPGDFDVELDALDPADAQVLDASRDRHLVLQFTLDGDDAA